MATQPDRDSTHLKGTMIRGVSIPATPLLALLSFLLAAPVRASGQLPPLPVIPQTFDSFAACADHLRQLHHDDMAGTHDGPAPIEGGATREKIVETEGVVVSGPDEARYDATVGWQIRSKQQTGNGERFIQTNYSYERKALICRAPTLGGTTQQGYYLPGMEAVPQGQ